MVTLHGEEPVKDLIKLAVISPEYLTKLQKSGFVYIVNNYMGGFFPSWYQSSYHTKEYVLDNFSKYFEVLDYREKGINNHQDLVILKNKN
jgi:hypothetical protein